MRGMRVEMADILLEYPVTCHALKSPLGVDMDTEE